MTTTAPAIVRCPLCGLDCEVVHHDIRASLIYSCQACLHEWQIDPADEPTDTTVPVGECPRASAGHPKGSCTATCLKRRTLIGE